MRSFQIPGRSPVMSTEAMAATSHPLATEAAIGAMRAGGSAADAVVAAAAVLMIAEPHMTGIGGDCFTIVSTPDGQLQGLNASGRSAAAATFDRLKADGVTAIDEDSIHAVTVPGSVAGWQALMDRYGKLGLDHALQPAIALAKAGCPVAPRVQHDWAEAVDRISRDAGMRAHYLPGGRAPAVGDRHALPALAATLERLASHGAKDGFYRGPVAADIAATVKAHGGYLSEADLEACEASWVAPITSSYRDIEVAEIPPNGQGLTALIMLNILDALGPMPADPFGAERMHRMIEAGRLAYACRDAFIADPAAMTVPVSALLDKAYGAALAHRIDPRGRLADVTPASVPAASTVYLTVVDRDGLMISFIQSIFSHFGAARATLNTGIVLQNRGHSFQMIEDHPNRADGAKRPMHTIIPGFVLKNGRPVMPFGVMGGAYQAMGHGQFISNMIDYGMDPQEALDAPRAFWTADKRSVMLETPFSAATRAGLSALGHPVVDADEPIGGGQAIFVDHARGVLIGGSDPRKDGCALGW